MKLLLSGGGSGEKSKLSYIKFSEETEGKPVLFIPFANDEMTYEESLEWFKNEVNPYGITNIKMVTTPQTLKEEKLENYGGVYLSGGNAFLLLKTLKENKLINVINDILKKDIILMGSSAGTSVFGKSINTCLRDDLKIAASDKNNVELKDTNGLNIINDYSYFVHYKLKESQYQQTKLRVNRLLNDGHKLICLPEETSIYLKDGNITVIGDSPCEVITNTSRKSYHPNESLLQENCLEK